MQGEKQGNSAITESNKLRWSSSSSQVVSMQHTAPQGLVQPGTPLFFNKKPRAWRGHKRKREALGRDDSKDARRRAGRAVSHSPTTPGSGLIMPFGVGRQSTRTLVTAARLIHSLKLRGTSCIPLSPMPLFCPASGTAILQGTV